MQQGILHFFNKN